MAAVMLFDGDCALCSRTVAFILRHERAPTISFVSTRSPEGGAIGAGHGIDPATLDATFAFVEDGRAFLRSDGALRVVAHLRAPWSWLAAIRVVPRPLRDAAYGLVSRNRGRFGSARCMVPTPETRARFNVT